MEIVGKDMVGLIFEQMTPTDWVCCSLVCKKWWNVIRKWMSFRRKQFIQCLEGEINLFGINILEEKDHFCIRPMYYLKSVGYGCKGKISNYICERHKILSLYNKEICEKCLKLPSSNKCFGNRCNSFQCRDYLYVLRNGETVKVPAYQCRVESCIRLTDSSKGFCYIHAVAYSCQDDEVLETPKYQCIALKKSGVRCTINTNSRLSKCHHHIFSPVSLI